MNQNVGSKKGGALKIILIIFGVLFLCGIVCVGSFGAFFWFVLNQGVDAITKDVSATVCDVNSNEIENIYQNDTTESFQRRVTLNEFQVDIQNINDGVCSELKDLTFWDVIRNSWSLNYYSENGEESIEFRGDVSGYDVDIVAEEEDGEFKLDVFSVDE